MSVEEEKTRGSGSGTFGGSNSSIASLSFKAPKFDKKYVKMWLELVEAGFITSNYTRPETKFAHTLQLMQPDQLVFVSDALASKDYETLKTAIIKAFCPSAASQRQKFHAPIELGNRSPRELFVEIRSIGNDIGCTAAAIRRRWLDALPTTYQNALVTHENDNDDGMVEWAERIHQNMLNESNIKVTVAATGASHRVVDSGTRQINENRYRTSTPVRLHQRNQSPTPRTGRRDVECYFHYWFGRNAQNCNRRNCSWRNRRSRNWLVASIIGCRMIVTCQKSNRRFLVDTGSARSTLPAKSCKTNIRLYAANGSEIKIIGTKRESIDLGLGRRYSWKFVVTIVYLWIKWNRIFTKPTNSTIADHNWTMSQSTDGF